MRRHWRSIVLALCCSLALAASTSAECAWVLWQELPVASGLEAYARGAGARGIAGGRTGSITVIQRAGGGLNVNPHFHTLVLDGVFREAEASGLEFHPAPGPGDDEVAAILARIRARVGRLLRRRGLAPEDAATGPADRLGEESSVLAGLVSASVQGRVALGARAGRRVRRLGDEADAEGVMSRGPRQAHLDGFDLHANVWVGTHDRAGLERLSRYILRPPFAQARMRLRGDGRVALELKRAWHDGTRELVFEPLEFLAEHVAHWAGSLDRRGGRSCAPWHWLLAAPRPAGV